MIKKVISITTLWLVMTATAHSDAPKAGLNVAALNSGLWPAEFKLTLELPKDHHAYLDKGDENIYIPIAIDPYEKLAASRLNIIHLKGPAGIYDPIVKANVLRDSGEFTFSVTPSENAAFDNPTLALEVRYQLCNEITSVCFRPQTTEVNLTLPGASTTINRPAHEGAADAEQESAGITDRLLSLFKNNQDNTFILFCLMLMGGILSVATPCVYPMLPITSMFIANRANGVSQKTQQHAFVYVMGITCTYMLLGLIAGMTGGAFNLLMQSAWLNILFALLFSFFAMALLGFYELAFMQNEVYKLDQHSAKIKGLTGSFLIGAVAGLVISPCVGPIVFALLLQVADQIADKTGALTAMGQNLTFWDKLNIATQGSLMMGGFGLGAGLPFFIISVVKFKKLPKANEWMNKIKMAFGLLVLYFAYVYFAKGMGVLGVEPTITLSLALGLASVWLAVVHCNVLSLLPIEAQPNQKMHHYLGVMLLIIGVWLVVASLEKTPIISDIQANHDKTTNLAIQEEAGISWHKNFDAALKVAQQTGKPIFIDFYASWCANCIAFKEAVANNPQLNQALREKAVALKLVDKEPEFEKFRENPEHRQLKIGLPYFAILSSQGKLIWSGTDYKATGRMVAILSTLEKGNS